MVDVSEYSRVQILQAILKGWKEVTKEDIPKYLFKKLGELIEKLDNLLQAFHLDQIAEIAYKEGILIAREQYA